MGVAASWAGDVVQFARRLPIRAPGGRLWLVTRVERGDNHSVRGGTIGSGGAGAVFPPLVHGVAIVCVGVCGGGLITLPIWVVALPVVYL